MGVSVTRNNGCAVRIATVDVFVAEITNRIMIHLVMQLHTF